MILTYPTGTSKPNAIEITLAYARNLGLHTVEQNIDKPWGAYFRFDEKDVDHFIDVFFADQVISREGLLTPKFLLVAPGEALSWQYHRRRSELWKVACGPIQLIQNTDDALVETKRYETDDLIVLGVQIRHRLMGDSTWGLVAEIWQHTDPQTPSDEADIVRVADRYNR
ncbi:MAG: phosphoheptose isomerase [Candidatus Roizmanbacteria bacterium]